jgi:hypothetical protein
VNEILSSFDKQADNCLKELDKYVLPNTKDLHLTRTLESVTKFAEKVAKKFDDDDIVSNIKNLFNL